MHECFHYSSRSSDTETTRCIWEIQFLSHLFFCISTSATSAKCKKTYLSLKFWCSHSSFSHTSWISSQRHLGKGLETAWGAFIYWSWWLMRRRWGRTGELSLRWNEQQKWSQSLIRWHHEKDGLKRAGEISPCCEVLLTKMWSVRWHSFYLLPLTPPSTLVPFLI